MCNYRYLTMKWIEHEIADWIYRLLGLCYIEEKLGKSLEKDEDFKKEIKKLKRMSIESLREHYDTVKHDKDFQKHPIFDILKRSFEKNPNGEDIKKAKELLKKHGFKVTK